MIVCTRKVRDELLEMGINIKVKHKVFSPPYKVQENFFHKQALHGGENFFGEIFWEMIYMGTNDQIMRGRKFMVRRF